MQQYPAEAMELMRVVAWRLKQSYESVPRRSLPANVVVVPTANDVPLDAYVAVDVLQSAGVPSGRVLDMRTIKDDPHLYARGFWIRVPNEKMHPYRKSGVVWRLLEANPTIARHAPYLGADNHDVLSTVAGLSAEEIAALEADGVIADTLGDIALG